MNNRSLRTLVQFCHEDAYNHEPQILLPYDEEKSHPPKACEILVEDPQNEHGMDMDCTFCLHPATTRLPVHQGGGARCGHYFHAACLQPWFDKGNGCPLCQRTYGDVVRTGSMPNGEMRWFILGQELPGCTCDTICMHFHFPSGHTNSGGFYRGRQQRAYLPNNEEGKKLLALFAIAFHRRLLFPLGESNTIPGLYWPTFGSIHFKTTFRPSPVGGHGYPDPAYEANVLEELRRQGVGADLADSAQGARLLEVAEHGPSCGYRLERFLKRPWWLCLACAVWTLPYAISCPFIALLLATMKLPPVLASIIMLWLFTLVESPSVLEKKALSPAGYIIFVSILYSVLAARFGRLRFFRLVALYARLFAQHTLLLSSFVLLATVAGRLLPLKAHMDPTPGIILAGYSTCVALFVQLRPLFRARRDPRAYKSGSMASPLLAERHAPL